jgi:hypothetical protein
MATTIQVSHRTLALLKKLKEQMNASSYEEAIEKVVFEKTRQKSMAGALKKYFKNENAETMAKSLQKERRKSDRL